MNIRELKNKIDISFEDSEELEHNIKVLLSLYRKVNFRVEERIQDLKLETYESGRKDLEDLILSILEIDNTINFQKLEDKIIGINDSLLLLKVMDKALERLKNYPGNGEQYGKIIESRFFVKDIYSHDIIMRKVNMSRTSYYRHLSKAIQSYGVMLFGYALPEVKDLITSTDNLMVAERTEYNYLAVK